jgi:2-iminobutanoate/2-iminopropanoate deaminase
MLPIREPIARLKGNSQSQRIFRLTVTPVRFRDIGGTCQEVIVFICPRFDRYTSHASALNSWRILPWNFVHEDSEMSKHVIQTKRGAPPRGAYSQGWRAGDFIYVTGTGPIDPVSGMLVGEDIERQTDQTINNISAILEADGASLRDVIKVSVHLSDTSLFSRYNAVYSSRFSQPYPARTTVGSDLGHSPGMLIEIDCIAYIGKKTTRPSLRKANSRRPRSKGR